MPVGYHKKCKLCNTEFRVAAETLHEQGTSFQRIVDFLAKKGLEVSRMAVKRHFDNHFAPKEEAARRYYEESQAAHEQAVGKRLEDLEMLDEVIQHNYELHIGATAVIKDGLENERTVYTRDGKPMLDPEDPSKTLKRKIPPASSMVDLLTGTSAEIRQSIKVKHDLVGDSNDGAERIVLIDDITDLDEAEDE